MGPKHVSEVLLEAQTVAPLGSADVLYTLEMNTYRCVHQSIRAAFRLDTWPKPWAAPLSSNDVPYMLQMNIYRCVS
jgi:hypothetical protein